MFHIYSSSALLVSIEVVFNLSMLKITLQRITFGVYHFLFLPVYYRPRFLNLGLLSWREMHILFCHLFLGVLRYRKYCHILCLFECYFKLFSKKLGAWINFYFYYYNNTFWCNKYIYDYMYIYIYKHNFLLWKLILTRDIHILPCFPSPPKPTPSLPDQPFLFLKAFPILCTLNLSLPV